MRLAAVGTMLFLLSSGSAFAKDYEFCVHRMSDSKQEWLHVRFKYGSLDPGKEAARVIVSQRYREGSTKSISVSDYSPQKCDLPETHEITVSASPEQLQKLAGEVASLDPGALVTAADIAAGGAVAIVKGAPGVIAKVWNWIQRIF